MAINNIEWLNNNMHRNYPLVDDCSATSTTGMYLPTSFITDMNIIAHDTGDLSVAERFFVSSILNTGLFIRVLISYNPPSGIPFECLMSEDIPSDIVASYSMLDKVFNLMPTASIPTEYTNKFKNLKASITIGTCEDIINMGNMVFDYESSIISPMAISVIAEDIQNAIDSITFMDKSGNIIGTVTDDFIIKAEDGISIAIDYSGEMPVVSFRRSETDAYINAEYKSVDDIVSAVKASIGDPILTINGTSPKNGNIVINGEACTTVTTGMASISISNTCSQPCCSSTSDSADAAIETLRDYCNRIINYFESMSGTINGIQSRIAALIAYRK